MKILLINNNPVVSRLTALSARKEDIEIDEIQEVTELNSGNYDIVFVDADSWTKDVRDVISENIKTQKSVIFYAEGDEEEKDSFDISILKPFLPSEVSAVIRSVEASSISLNKDTQNEQFNLDGFDELEDKKEEISLNLDEDLDLNTKDISFDEKLEEAFSLKNNTLDDDLLDDNDLFDLDLSDDTPSLENDLFAEEKKSEDKKDETTMVMDKFELEDDTLEMANTLEEKASLSSLEEDLPLEVDAPLIEEVKKETQILDELEIENIKGILTEDTSDDMTLGDLMPAMAVMPSVVESTTKKDKKTKDKKVKKEEFKEEEEVDDSLDFDSNVLSQTLAAMPVENLRQLLSGAKINIKIKFPKSK